MPIECELVAAHGALIFHLEWRAIQGRSIPAEALPNRWSTVNELKFRLRLHFNRAFVLEASCC